MPCRYMMAGASGHYGGIVRVSCLLSLFPVRCLRSTLELEAGAVLDAVVHQRLLVLHHLQASMTVMKLWTAGCQTDRLPNRDSSICCTLGLLWQGQEARLEMP